MVLQDLWDLYTKRIFPMPSTDTLFNQYRDTDPDVDLPGAHTIRRANLKRYLESYRDIPGVLVVGEAAGPWGMRFSGVPFTSERQLTKADVPFPGEVSSIASPAVRVPRRSPYSSVSATIFWRVMKPYYPAFVAVDAVPLYPHKPGELLRKSTPSSAELRSFSGALEATLDIIGPKHIIAVGDKAAAALDPLGVEVVTVHHTAHDAKQEFPAGMDAFFRKLR